MRMHLALQIDIKSKWEEEARVEFSASEQAVYIQHEADGLRQQMAIAIDSRRMKD